MQIYCPKCNAGYEIDENLIADKVRRVKCSACGEIFTAGNLKTEQQPEVDIFAAVSAAMAEAENITPVEESDSMEENLAEDSQVAVEVEKEDFSAEQAEPVETTEENAVAEEPVNIKDLGDGRIEPSFSAEDEEISQKNNEEEQPVDLEKIFERLSEHTEHLIAAEKKLPIYEKIWLQIKNILGFHFKIKWSYIILALMVFVLLSSYNNRYQIVRKVPFLNGVYKAFGIKAMIPGEGLEFQNIGWDYVKDDEGARLIVKGFVHNPTEREIALPVIHIEILDKETVLLQSHNREVSEDEVEPNAKIPLSLTLANPAPNAKYVYLTFIDKD